MTDDDKPQAPEPTRWEYQQPRWQSIGLKEAMTIFLGKQKDAPVIDETPDRGAGWMTRK